MSEEIEDGQSTRRILSAKTRNGILFGAMMLICVWGFYGGVYLICYILKSTSGDASGVLGLLMTTCLNLAGILILANMIYRTIKGRPLL